MTTTFHSGNQVVWQTECYVIHRQLPSGAIVLQHSTTEAISTHTQAELTQALFAGELNLVGTTGDAPLGGRELADYPAPHVAIALARVQILGPLLNQPWTRAQALTQLAWVQQQIAS